MLKAWEEGRERALGSMAGRDAQPGTKVRAPGCSLVVRLGGSTAGRVRVTQKRRKQAWANRRAPVQPVLVAKVGVGG